MLKVYGYSSENADAAAAHAHIYSYFTYIFISAKYHKWQICIQGLLKVGNLHTSKKPSTGKE